MQSQLTDEKTIILRMQSGDSTAFEQVYRHYWQRLYHTARHKLHSDEDAEELVQNLFVSLWERRSKTTFDNLEAYLFTALKYQIINKHKANLLNSRFVEANVLAGGMPDDQTEQLLRVNELTETFGKALHQLPDRTRTIFELSRVEQKSVREIAAQLNMPERTVEHHITQGIRHLRTALSEYLPLIVVWLSA